jgi:acyl transferase domain-containing protein/acyl carrier protein
MSLIPEHQSDLTQLKQALSALQKARARLDMYEKSQKEPIAVIGMSCRFPGAANSPEAFWRLLENGTDAISEVPDDRWNIDQLFDSDPAAAGKMNSRWGGFIDQIDQFDPNFFGISPREASQMDPQQRLTLEVAWEAVEDAGLTKTDLAGSQTGVYVGVHSHSSDYLLQQYADRDAIDIYTGTGTAHNVIAGRLAYLLDLRGPTITVDTACSSSLAAVHLACQSLRIGESRMAIVAGVNLILSPEFTIAATKMHMMAPDGRCKAFDSQANGFVRGEGCGVVILKRLSDAHSAGDNILAVIRGSAINQDGHTNGLTAPNGLSQQQVIHRALENAGVQPSEISYIEAHGTGTSLGDVIELEAISEIFGRAQQDRNTCFLGSAKTNIGHLEGAAGIAGLIKTVLSLQKKMIPPVVHFRNLNPNITLEQTSIRVPTQLQPWNVDQKRLAGVSSFGWSGTNVHVVLEEAPSQPVAHQDSPSGERAHLLLISAQSMRSLNSLAKSNRKLLLASNREGTDSGTQTSLEELCYTASLRRSHHEYRLAVAGRTHQELAEQLNSFLQGKSEQGISTGHAEPGHSPRIAFVFPGQGSQWIGMGRDLLAKEPVFRESILACQEAIKLYTDWDLLDQLQASADMSRLDEIDIIQPTLFAIQVSLAALWRSWGITPDAVIGHSMGEIAAAHIAGALGLQEAARIICTRSRLLRRVSGQGVMAVVGLSFEQAQLMLKEYEGQISVAVSNSPRSTVVSGDPQAMEKLFEELLHRNVFHRLIKVDVASHSPQMDPLLADLVSGLQGLKSTPAAIPLYSTVTGTISDGLSFGASYWSDNLRKPVVFSKMIAKMLEDDHTVFIEISPHPILLSAVEETMQHSNKPGVTIPSLLRDEDEQSTMLRALGELYTIGYSVDWKKQHTAGGRFVSLPKYSWDHQRYWIKSNAQDNAASRQGRQQIMGEQQHPLLGMRLPSLAHQPESFIWQTKIDAAFSSYLNENNITDPIQGLVYAATNSIFGEMTHLITDIHIHTPFNLEGATGSKLQIILSAQDGKSASFQIHAQPIEQARTWTKLAEGEVELGKADAHWLYKLLWEAKPTPDTATSTAKQNGTWVIFSDQKGLGTRLSELLDSRGDDIISVYCGQGFRSNGKDYTIDPENIEGFKQVLAEIKATKERPLHGVIYLWGLDAPSPENLKIDTLRTGDRFGITGLLHLTQSMLQQESDSMARVWTVTKGVQPVVESGSYEVAQSLLWGFGRGIAVEHPQLWGGLIDLSPGEVSTESNERNASLILAEVFSGDRERQIAFRGNERFVARLVRANACPIRSGDFKVRPDGTYLLTGGLGVLGLEIAHWLVGLGARHLILTSRTGLSPKNERGTNPRAAHRDRMIESFKELEARGATIQIVTADVSDPSQMADVFERLNHDGLTLSGVFHLAGLEIKSPVQELTLDIIDDVLEAKVTGSWILHKLLQAENGPGNSLDFFVMFSSVVSMWGSRGLAHYSAANHFMDTLAQYRRSKGLPALSINWGFWAGSILGKGELEQQASEVGLNQMPAENALAGMKYLLETNATQAMVASVDWNTFKPVYEARQKHPLLEEITMEKTVTADSDPGETTDTFARQLTNTFRGEQRGVLLAHVREQVAEVLGLESPETLDIQQGFFRLGMDSITTVRLRNRLERSLTCTLPATVAFEYPSIDTLTTYLANNILNLNATNDEPTMEKSGKSIKSVPAIPLSENELLSQLDDELAAFKKLTDETL